MDNAQRQLVNNFGTKLERLIFLYETAKERVTKLEEQLTDANKQLNDTRNEIVEIRADYENLKTARMMGFSEEDKKKAYLRLTNLVREIDKCLELLND